MSDNIKNVILIGTGPMAVAHAKVLQSLNANITVIGRGLNSAAYFENETGLKPITGGFSEFLTNHSLKEDDNIIIAVGTEMLMPILHLLVTQKFKVALIEKPGAISIEELLTNEEKLKPIQDKVFLAYNRRNHASVKEALKMISEDGGLKSMHFEFTEWSHRITPLKKAEGVKENWFFANSTHVVDLAFYLAGVPTNWNCFSTEGNLSWHKKTNFSGAGITKSGVLFSYISNWESAGRWGIELLTKNRRIYLKPLETLQVQEKGKIAIELVTIDDELDLKYKPGLYSQTQDLLFGTPKMPSLKEQFYNSRNIYSKILS